VPYCAGSRLPNILWLMPWSMTMFIVLALNGTDYMIACRGSA
jgi:hypothetical protein